MAPPPTKSPLAAKLTALWQYRLPIARVMYFTGLLAFLALPLGAKKGYHDEKSLLIGSASLAFRGAMIPTVMKELFPRLLPLTSTTSTLASLINSASSIWDPSSPLTWHTSTLPISVPKQQGPFGSNAQRQQQDKDNVDGLDNGASATRGGCSLVHTVIPAGRGDGTESLAVVLSINLNNPLGGNNNFKASPNTEVESELRQAEGSGSRETSGETAALVAAVGIAAASGFESAAWLAKDVVFVFVDTSQCEVTQAVEAWLKEYNSANGNKNSSRFSRAGAIQQAVILDIQTAAAGEARISVHGTNGQLPNYDMFWLLRKNLEYFTVLPVGVTPGNAPAQREQKGSVDILNDFKSYTQELTTAAVFTWHLITGRSTGAHSPFLSLGIDSGTVSFLPAPSAPPLGPSDRWKIEQTTGQAMSYIEAVVRTCNNLQENLHHASALYVLVSPDRFVPIGVYIAAPGLMLGALLLLFADSLSTATNPSGRGSHAEGGINKSERPSTGEENWQAAWSMAGLAHGIGALLLTVLKQIIHRTTAATADKSNENGSTGVLSGVVDGIVVAGLVGLGVAKGIGNLYVALKGKSPSSISSSNQDERNEVVGSNNTNNKRACTLAACLAVFIAETVFLLLMNWASSFFLLTIFLPLAFLLRI